MPHFMYNYIFYWGTGTSSKEKFRKENFQTGFVVAGGGFLSYWNHQQIKFEEEKRFGLLKQFCYYEKGEIHTLENFPCDFFLARYPCAFTEPFNQIILKADMVK